MCSFTNSIGGSGDVLEDRVVHETACLARSIIHGVCTKGNLNSGVAGGGTGPWKQVLPRSQISGPLPEGVGVRRRSSPGGTSWLESTVVSMTPRQICAKLATHLAVGPPTFSSEATTKSWARNAEILFQSQSQTDPANRMTGPYASRNRIRTPRMHPDPQIMRKSCGWQSSEARESGVRQRSRVTNHYERQRKCDEQPDRSGSRQYSRAI